MTTPDPEVGYLVRHRSSGRYLERVPYDGRIEWLAPLPSYATVFTRDDAVALAGEHGPAEILVDIFHRSPFGVCAALLQEPS